MKNKRNRIILGIVGLTLFLGVVYASVTGVGLLIQGTASSDSHNLDVFFNGTVVSNTSGASGNVTVTPAATNGTLAATIDVTGLENVGDYVTATYTIKNNESDLKAKIELDTDKGTNGIVNNKTEFFTVTSDSIEGSPIAPGETGNVTIKIALAKATVKQADSKANITVYYKATPTQ